MKLFPHNFRVKRIQMAQIIDGKQIANDIRTELKTKIHKWVQEGHRPPQLTAVLIGNDPASCTYVKNKMKVSIVAGNCFSSIIVHVDLLLLITLHRNTVHTISSDYEQQAFIKFKC